MDEQVSFDGKVFKYKLDFYYTQTILYLVALLVWAGIKGTFALDELPSVRIDPMLYIILFFVVVAMTSLVLNMFRGRKLIIMQDRMIFQQKDRERVVMFSDVEWMYIGKERTVQTAGRFQVVLFKLKERMRLVRVRIGRYERDEELLKEMERISEFVPKIKRPMQTFRSSIGQQN